MEPDKHTREKMLELCGDIHEDDGVDPREFFKTSHESKKDDYKARQLCRQVAETLDQVLSGEARMVNVILFISGPEDEKFLFRTLSPSAINRRCVIRTEKAFFG